MIVFIAVLAVICVWGIQLKPAGGQEYITDYMSVDKTMAIKGIFILIVFVSHFNSYADFTSAADIKYFQEFSKIGQRMVTLFLFYSGYGVMESVKKKKMNYVHTIPVKRILNVLFRFDIAILLFAVLNLALGKAFTLKQFLLSLVCWDSLGNSNWYIFAIIVSYAITFIAFEIFRDKGNYYLGAAATVILTVLFVCCFAYFNIKDAYWYDTVICYALGVVYSLCRDKIEKIVNAGDTLYVLLLAVVVFAAHFSRVNKGSGFLMNEIHIVTFLAAVVLVTMRVSFNNAFLRRCGRHLFGIYILQRIPMIIFSETGFMEKHLYLSFVLSFVITLLIAWLFEKYINKLWKIISAPKKHRALN